MKILDAYQNQEWVNLLLKLIMMDSCCCANLWFSCSLAIYQLSVFPVAVNARNSNLFLERMYFIMKKIIYLAKQLLPLSYHSKYRVQNGSKELAIWTQWFGKPFNIKRYTLAD